MGQPGRRVRPGGDRCAGGRNAGTSTAGAARRRRADSRRLSSGSRAMAARVASNRRQLRQIGEGGAQPREDLGAGGAEASGEASPGCRTAPASSNSTTSSNGRPVGELVEGMAANDQPSAGAVDIRKHGFGRHDIIQSIAIRRLLRCARKIGGSTLTSILINMINVRMAMWLRAEEALDRLGSKAADAVRQRQPGPDPGASGSEPTAAAASIVPRMSIGSRRGGGAPGGGEGGGRGDQLGRPGARRRRSRRSQWAAWYYRGRDAAELSRTASLEDVAELLWGGRVPRRHQHSARPRGRRRHRCGL